MTRTSDARREAKAVLWEWLDNDGFQEGADGVSQVIDAVFDDAPSGKWYREWIKAKDRPTIAPIRYSHTSAPGAPTHIGRMEDCPICAGTGGVIHYRP